MKINVIVVVYNELFGKIDFSKMSFPNDMELVLYLSDNSVDNDIKAQNIELASHIAHAKYVDNGGNVGLSVAYNNVLKQISDSAEYIVIFDGDTCVPNDYFDSLHKAIAESNADVLAPKVLANGVQISPSSLKKYRVRKFNGKNATAINSGMAIKRSVFERVGLYDESLFLDYIDHYFMRKCNQNGVKIATFDTVIEQTFSGQDFSNINSGIARFKIFRKDFKYFCGKKLLGKIYYYIKLWKRTINLTLKYKSLSFVKIVLRGAK